MDPTVLIEAINPSPCQHLLLLMLSCRDPAPGSLENTLGSLMNGVSTCLLCPELIFMFRLGVLLIFECSTSVFYPNPCKRLEISSSYAPVWLPHVLIMPGADLGKFLCSKTSELLQSSHLFSEVPTISRLISHTSCTWGLNPREDWK